MYEFNDLYSLFTSLEISQYLIVLSFPPVNKYEVFSYIFSPHKGDKTHWTVFGFSYILHKLFNVFLQKNNSSLFLE